MRHFWVVAGDWRWRWTQRVPLPWADLCRATGCFSLGERFINKPPSFLGTCPMSCASCSTVFVFSSEVNGQDLPSWHTSPGAEQKKRQAELWHCDTGSSEKKPDTACKRNKIIFYNAPSPKKPLRPKIQLPKMFLHLFCMSLFAVDGVGQAPHHACCRMWPWALLLPWPWAHACSSGNNNTANKGNDCRAARIYLMFSQVM